MSKASSPKVDKFKFYPTTKEPKTDLLVAYTNFQCSSVSVGFCLYILEYLSEKVSVFVRVFTENVKLFVLFFRMFVRV